MNKPALLTGILGIVVGSAGTFAYSATAPTPSMLRGNHDMHDAMEMSMNDMATMLDGKTGTAFDLAFIDGMIPHHQGAIDMAEAALLHAGHDEIKAMARAIIEAQQSEIDMMRGWREAWATAAEHDGVAH